MLRGIDISVYKSDLNLAAIHFDFVVEKATGGIGYVNPDCDNKIQNAMQLGKKWGVFHYFGDGYNDNDPIEEANYFVDNVLGYVGKGTFWLDWERGGNPNVNRVDMALAWLNHVHDRTGVKAGIYMSMSIYTALDWSPVIVAGYALWVAAWPENNNIVPNYGIDPALDPNPKWDGVVGDVIWQFTSTGRLDGYGGNLDCDLFYGDGNAWDNYARPDVAPTTTTTATQAPAPPAPEPSTTTTTTETTTSPPDSQPTPPAPPASTTTTATSQTPPYTQAAWLAVVWGAVVAIFNWLRGKQ